ncbi:phage tail length tape measure family protein [Xanthobacter sp. VTT E-85241]|uniref:phage tail length tape measure family protein n=1 Tax=Roseixanthobacter finlandensis TaxID=3119922 RepID=UPI00372A863D
MADVATLGLAIDSADVEKGARSLDKLSTSAKKAEGAASALESAYAAAGKSAGGASNAAAAASRAYDEQASAATRAANASARLAGAVNDNAKVQKAAYLPTANLAAQFQDIGVTAAMSMNPLQIALQQGTQISAALGPLGAAGAVQALGQAFVSVFSPLSLLIITLVALVAAGLQMIEWAKVGAAVLNALASVIVKIAPYAAVAGAALAVMFAPQIIAGAVQLVALMARLALAAGAAAIAMAAANPALAFVAGVAVAVTAAAVFQKELAKIFGVDIVAEVKRGVNYIIGAFVAAFNDIKFLWNTFPTIMGAAAIGTANAVLSAMETMINKGGELLNAFIRTANTGLEKIGAPTLPEVGAVSFNRLANPSAAAADKAGALRAQGQQADLSRDYLGGLTSAAATGATAAAAKLKELAKGLLEVDDADKKSGRTAKDKYAGIIAGADRRIASLQAEAAGLGLTEEAASRLRYEQDLLNQAQQADITLSAAQRAELMAKAATMAEVETAAKKVKEAFDFAKDATKGFLSDFRQGLQSGQSVMQAFGNAVSNVVDKIVSKLEGELVDSLFNVGKAGSGAGSNGGGGIGGLLSSLFSGLGGGGTVGATTGASIGLSSGGYTGDGPVSKAAGIVHGKEYVFSAAATRAIGVNNLEAMHRQAKGYRDGGYVGTFARTPAASNSNAPAAPLINIYGAPAETRTETSEDGQRVDIYLEKQVARTLSRTGSEPQRVLRSQYGANVRTARR